MDPNAALTPWIVLGVVGPTLLGAAVAFLKWYANTMLAKLEGTVKELADLKADITKVRAAEALADQKRDRDVSDLQTGYGKTLGAIETMGKSLDTRISESNIALRGDMKAQGVEWKQELTRVMLQFMPAKRRAKAKG